MLVTTSQHPKLPVLLEFLVSFLGDAESGLVPDLPRQKGPGQVSGRAKDGDSFGSVGCGRADDGACCGSA
jgi:hypothetical protein